MDRRELILRKTKHLMTRMDEAAATADLQVLLHSQKSSAVVRSSNYVGACIVDFHRPLGIELARLLCQLADL